MFSGSLSSPAASIRFLVTVVLATLVTNLPLPGEERESPENPAFFREWTGSLEGGQTLQSGRTRRNEITLRGELERQVGRHSHRAVAEYIYGKQDGSKSSDRYGTNYRWRYELNDYFYTQSLTSFEADHMRRIRERAEQNLSFGYRFLDTERMGASFGPGVTAQYNREIGVESEMNYLATFFQDFTWQMTDTHHFKEDSTFLFNPENSEDYTYRFNATFSSNVTQAIDLRLRYNFIYENQVAPDVEQAEHRLTTSLRYSF